MKTGAHLKVVPLGSNTLGVRLEGDKRKPEPDEFRVEFPGGDISVARCTNGTFWAHIRVDHRDSGHYAPGEFQPAKIVEARMDVLGKPAHETTINPDPGLYHLAVRIELEKP